jgi:DNA-binding transcriptional regulator YdaS (Cro superfamily)
MWIEILKKEVAARGPKQIAHELGVSRTTVDLVCHGKYPGSTERVEKRIRSIYGTDGHVSCPVLEQISPARCADTWRKARAIGMKAGNPETLKLYKACLKCTIRG